MSGDRWTPADEESFLQLQKRRQELLNGREERVRKLVDQMLITRDASVDEICAKLIQFADGLRDALEPFDSGSRPVQASEAPREHPLRKYLQARIEMMEAMFSPSHVRAVILAATGREKFEDVQEDSFEVLNEIVARLISWRESYALVALSSRTMMTAMTNAVNNELRKARLPQIPGFSSNGNNISIMSAAEASAKNFGDL